MATAFSSGEQVKQLYSDIKDRRKIHDKIVIPTNEGFIILNVSEIIYCHAISNYTEFNLSDGKRIVSSHTLKQYDEILTGQFVFGLTALISLTYLM